MEIPEGKLISDILNIGDEIKIGDLRTTVKDVKLLFGQVMISTDYGDFNISVVEKMSWQPKF